MNLLVVASAVLPSPLLAESEAATASLKRFVELGKQSELITKESSEKDVASILGEPQSKGTGGWIHPEKKVWHYLDYTDDSLHRRFSVWFDPKAGCSVSEVEISRSEIEKAPLLVLTAKVIQVIPNYPEEGANGFLCSVQFKRDGREFTSGVAVATLDRVKGSPKIGATIRVEHRGPELDCIFVGPRSLYLESMAFTDDSEPVAPSDGAKRSN